jgi:solute:Na+ symporter, SSS family
MTSPTSLADIVGFLALPCALAWYSWRVSRRDESFLLADRALGLLPLVATLVMTEFNTSTLLAFSALGYSAGPMALALPLVFLIGLGFYTVTVSRAWKRFDRLSVAELFAARYSPALGRFVSLLLIVAMTGFSATYVKSLGLIVQPLMPQVAAPLVSAVLTVVVLAVVLPGGLVSVVRSDVAGFVITAVVLPALLVLGMARSRPFGGLAAAFPADQLVVAPIAQWTHPALPFWFVSSLVVLTCFTYIAAPWYGQKIFAAKDTRTAFVAVGISAVLVCLLYGVVVLAAAHLRVVHPGLADPQLAVPTMMLEWLPPLLRGAGLATLFVAALTTLAGVWTAMAAMVAADFGWPAARATKVQRRLLAGFAVASWLGAVGLVDDILNRLILANVPVAGLSFALLAGFHWPRATTAAAWASTLVGIAWGAGAFVLIGEAGGYTWTWSIYGVPLIFATGVVVSLGWPRRTVRALPAN